METDIDVIMDRLSPYLDRIDAILRHGHEVYETYTPGVVLDHDASTQAHCTNRHILAEAHRALTDIPGVRYFEVNGQSLWLIDPALAILRFKKTDENGVSSNYQTQQAIAFDQGDEIPGLPEKPTRLTAGYLLDVTGTKYKRSQISLPKSARDTVWCAAIIPVSSRDAEEGAWYEVTRQGRFFG